MANLRYINATAVRQRAIELAGRKWKDGRFTRVGASFLERINAAAQVAIEREISQHPTLGKTLK